MRRTSFARATSVPLFVGVVLAFGSACTSDANGVRTVADFDDRPCELFTDDVLGQIVGPPYKDLAQVDPTLTGSSSSESGDDTYACTYTFKASKPPAVTQVTDMTVTVAHSKTGSQPYSICSAGAQTKANGYRSEKIGDGACLSPSSDLWLKMGTNFFHIVVVPQPGFGNPVEANQALAPLILTVAQGAADRIPRS